MYLLLVLFGSMIVISVQVHHPASFLAGIQMMSINVSKLFRRIMIPFLLCAIQMYYHLILMILSYINF